MITRESLEQKLTMLKAQQRQLADNEKAVLGAIQLIEYLFDELNTPTATDKDTGNNVEQK